MNRTKAEQMNEHISNEGIAEILEQTAHYLDMLDENEFRVRSYQRAASIIRNSDDDIADMVENFGAEPLKEFEGIGDSLSAAIAQIVATGQFPLLERLMSEVDPIETLRQVPGIGQKLASHIHDELGISSLEELEDAAIKGDLLEIDGIAAEKAGGIKHAVQSILSQRQPASEDSTEDCPEPSVKLLLAIDEEYRRLAQKDDLPKISPKRHNPDNEAWLPIWETERDGWNFTVLFSNTERAHRLKKTDDWVVIFCQRDNCVENRYTVITQAGGTPGKSRIVRGRERESKPTREESFKTSQR